MRRCVQCGSREFRDGIEPLKADFPNSGVSAAINTPVRKCAVCGETYMAGNALGEFELAVAQALAEHGFHTGETFRYVRKALGLRAADLARLLGVTPETVSHWETGRVDATPAAFATLGAMVRDQVEGRTTTRESLIAMADNRPRPKILHPKLARTCSAR